MHSKQDIENAARLVSDQPLSWALNSPHLVGRSPIHGGIVRIARWQPWADTDAGRSDALVLYRKVMQVQKLIGGLTAELSDMLRDLERMAGDPNMTDEEFQAATFAAAVAIGAHMKGVNSKVECGCKPFCEDHGREEIAVGPSGEFCNECAADGWSGELCEPCPKSCDMLSNEANKWERSFMCATHAAEHAQFCKEALEEQPHDH